MTYTPLSDVALTKLYKAISGISPIGLPLTEQQETKRQHEAVLAEIADFKETEQLKRLARAIDLSFDDRPQLSDSQLMRLLRAVR